MKKGQHIGQPYLNAGTPSSGHQNQNNIHVPVPVSYSRQYVIGTRPGGTPARFDDPQYGFVSSRLPPLAFLAGLRSSWIRAFVLLWLEVFVPTSEAISDADIVSPIIATN